MGKCECSLSRPLRPATYASLPKEFVSGCIDRESMFGRNFDTLSGVKLQDVEVRRLHMYRERERTAMHDLTRGVCRCVRGWRTLRSAIFLCGGWDDDVACLRARVLAW